MYHFYKFNFEYIINSRFGFVSNFLYRGDVVPDKKLDFKIFLGSFLSFLRCRKHSAAVKNTQRPINCWPRGRRFYRGKGIVKKTHKQYNLIFKLYYFWVWKINCRVIKYKAYHVEIWFQRFSQEKIKKFLWKIAKVTRPKS